MGDIFCGENSEKDNEEDLKEWLGDSGASLRFTYTKKNMTNIEECNIDVTVGNCHKMKCDIRDTVNMKLQAGGVVKLTEVLYVP